MSLFKALVKPTLVILSLVVIEGCATHANFTKKYDVWVGHSIIDFINKIGYPDNTFVLPNKHKVYVYEESHVYNMPSPMLTVGSGYYGGYYGGYYNMYGYAYNNEVIQESCKLFIETNKKGIILKWGSRGNHCVSH